MTHKFHARALAAALLALSLSAPLLAGKPSKVWVADLGYGSYQNPVLHADSSDPDVVRVGGDFHMTASSFNASPGCPSSIRATW